MLKSIPEIDWELGRSSSRSRDSLSPCLVESSPGIGKGQGLGRERGKTSLLANIALSWNSWPVIGRLFGWQPEAGA